MALPIAMIPRTFSSWLALAFLIGTISTSIGDEKSQNFTLDASITELTVLKQGKPVVRYMHAYDPEGNLTATYKPYLHVFDAEGQSPITKGPGGDFPHHRAIFIGWNKIQANGKTYDRWHMKGGSQIHQEFIEKKAAPEGAEFTSVVLWEGEPDESIITENRTFKILPASDPFYTIIDLTSEITARTDLTLDGDPEHAGIQFRPAQNVDRSKTAYLFPKENADPTKDLDYPWYAENFALPNGKTYSVVYLNHPTNPQNARTSAYRDYGRFGSFYKTSIKKGESQTFKVRFLIAEGPLPSAEVIQCTWNQYTGQSAPTPKTTLRSTAKKSR